jgi:methionine-rich copper-binding protein CopC
MTRVPHGVAAFLGQCPAPRSLYIDEHKGGTRTSQPSLSRRRILLIPLVAVAGAAAGIDAAEAHSRLVKSDPPARAVVPASPREVKLWFNEQVEPAFAKIWIAPAQGEHIALASRGDASDARLLVAQVSHELPDGPVVIGFHVLSVDGHTIEDKLTFTIKKPA